MQSTLRPVSGGSRRCCFTKGFVFKTDVLVRVAVVPNGDANAIRVRANGTTLMC